MKQEPGREKDKGRKWSIEQDTQGENLQNKTENNNPP